MNLYLGAPRFPGLRRPLERGVRGGRSLLTFALLLPACTCSEGSRPTPAGATPAVPAVANAGSSPSTAASGEKTRALALAKVSGSTGLDARIARLQGACRAQPDKADNWVLLGRHWVRRARESADPGFYLNAGASADIALELEPDNRAALNVRAMVLLNQHRFEEAREVAQKALALDAEDSMALGSLSDALLELGEASAARDAANRMVAAKPGLPSYARVSYLSWLFGDDKAALESIRLAIDSAGGAADREPRAWALVQAADIFWHRGDYEGADAGYQMALKGFAKYAPARVGRGRVRLAAGDAIAAVEHFAAALELAPSVETANWLHQAQVLAGQTTEAEQTLRRAEQLGAAEPRALSLFYSARGMKPAKAVELARRERTQRGDVYTEDALAWALFRSGQVAEALPVAERAIQHNTPDARLLFHRGALLLAAGKSREGRAALSRALELNPHFDVLGADEAKRLLSDSEKP